MSIEDEVKAKAAQTQQIEARIKDLENTSRICQNNINLLNEMEIKGAYAKPVAEVTDWLAGLHQTIQNQLVPLKSMLPKPEEPIVPEVVIPEPR
jgi:hypothetical protein